MPTQCNAEQLEFSCVERRRVVAAFDGGTVSSDAGALLLQRTDQAIGAVPGLARTAFVSDETHSRLRFLILFAATCFRQSGLRLWRAKCSATTRSVRRLKSRSAQIPHELQQLDARLVRLRERLQKGRP